MALEITPIRALRRLLGVARASQPTSSERGPVANVSFITGRRAWLRQIRKGRATENWCERKMEPVFKKQEPKEGDTEGIILEPVTEES